MEMQTLMILGLMLAIYFLPAIIANGTRHHNQAAIFVLNLVAGWTLIGWVAALVWAFVKPQARRA